MFTKASQKDVKRFGFFTDPTSFPEIRRLAGSTGSARCHFSANLTKFPAQNQSFPPESIASKSQCFGHHFDPHGVSLRQFLIIACWQLVPASAVQSCSVFLSSGCFPLQNPDFHSVSTHSQKTLLKIDFRGNVGTVPPVNPSDADFSIAANPLLQ